MQGITSNGYRSVIQAVIFMGVGRMKKRIKLLTLLVVAVFSLSILITGCGKVAEKASEKATEKAIESASGGNAQVDVDKDKMTVKTKDGSMQVGGTNEWPSKIPSDVPKFSYGKIDSVAETNTGDGQSVIVSFEGVAMPDLEKYKSDIESAGWKVTMTTKSDDGYWMSAEKDKNAIALTFANKSDSGYSGAFAWTQENNK